nr:hypothetical protein [uncultured bacterium]
MPHVIVLLPGIGGSRLAKDGQDLWAFRPGAIGRGLLSLGRNLEQLALTDDSWEVDDLGDGIEPVAPITDVHIIPGLWKIDGYEKIAAELHAAFDLRQGENYFDFAYDWRRDNRVAARGLARQAHTWLKNRRERGYPDAKLVLIGHSMGGIVARTFLELFDGWKDTAMLVTFGTPYGGSVKALDVLANGFTKRLGPVMLVDLTDMLRSFTSVYQLLPIFRCIEQPDGTLVHLADASEVPNLDPSKVAAARHFHAELRSQVDDHRNTDYAGTGGYDLRPIVGHFQPTLQSARITGGLVESLLHRGGADEGGDGTVPMMSAMPHEHLQDRANVTFAAERHASLQNFDPVLVQLRALLRGHPADPAMYYAITTRVSLDVEDAYLGREPVVIRARPEVAGVSLVATVIDVRSGAVAVRRPLEGVDEGGWQEVRLGGVPPGDYRVTVSGGPGVDPVTDIFTVLDPALLTAG